MITIISKIELEGSDYLKYTDIGHTQDVNIINQINEDYDASLGLFLGENRTKLELGIVSVSAFFANTPFVTEARTQVEDTESLGLIEVTDINQL
tara:strand:- start:775 stop:1056 length:282 start_codon:yes stop_codon:yes gene_type:complete